LPIPISASGDRHAGCHTRREMSGDKTVLLSGIGPKLTLPGL
jgi:hypothetical protein